MGGSTNGGTPKWRVHSGNSHLEMDDDWGYPLVRKPPSLVYLKNRSSFHWPDLAAASLPWQSAAKSPSARRQTWCRPPGTMPGTFRTVRSPRGFFEEKPGKIG